MSDSNQSLFTPLFARLFIPFGSAYFFSVMVGSANAIMSPILVSAFALSPSDLGFMTSVYLVAFGLAQFPLGVFLDRYGARETLALSLLLSVLGLIVFASAGSMLHLVMSRALLGFGMSGCLMGSFKAYAEWLPPERLPLVYSIQGLMGGIGGMAATRPVAVTFEIMGWRTVFVILALLTLIVSASIWFVVPKSKSMHDCADQTTFGKSLMTMLSFLKDARFWYVAPVITAGQAVMFAFLYLWIGPWMRDVACFSETRTGLFMMYVFTGAALGYFLNGVLADWFQKKGWLTWEKLYLYIGVGMTLSLCFITFNNGPASAAMWAVTMFLANMTMIAFPLIRTLFNVGEVGRVFSLLNFIIFLLSFIVQWFIGIVLDFYPVAGGHFSPTGYRLSIALIAALNLVALAHLYLSLRKLGKIQGV